MSELSRFTILPALSGWEVIDGATGRPVDHRETAQSANGAAQYLNEAARGGTLALQGALCRSNPSAPSDPDSIRAWVREPMLTGLAREARDLSRRELSEDH